MVFVSYKKGPKWWTNISFGVFKVLVVVMNWAVIPVTSVIISVTIMCQYELQTNPLSCFVIFWSVDAIYRILEFVFEVRRSILKDVKAYNQEKEVNNQT
jgi:hypothetical protein